MFKRLWKHYRVLKTKDMSVYPHDWKNWRGGRKVTFHRLGPGGGRHWHDYSAGLIDLFITEHERNWDRWFKGHRKVHKTLILSQVWNLASDAGLITQRKDWLEKAELEPLKQQARKLASAMSYYYSTLSSSSPT